MAYVMTLNTPAKGLSRILNVENHVGPNSDARNDPSDVKAVQQLLAIAAKQFASVQGFGLPQPTGRFDPITGFYIFYSQEKLKHHAPGTVVDGTISPAHGVNYGGGVWSIVTFNYSAFTVDRAAWEALLAQYSTRGGPTSGAAPGSRIR